MNMISYSTGWLRRVQQLKLNQGKKRRKMKVEWLYQIHFKALLNSNKIERTQLENGYRNKKII